MNKLIHSLFITLIILIAAPLSAEEYLRLATTTSTENSGLLAELNPVFEKKTGIKVHVIAVGTGKALRLGRDGDVDLVMVHAPAAEMAFVEQGSGIERQPLMHNDFVILGSPDDPAGISEASTVAEAFRRIQKTGSTFVSRGDDSGTHKKEKQLWALVGSEDPSGEWYLAVGQGMGQVLRIADEKLAYTLSDRGTYLAFSDKLLLQVLFENADELINPYHVILVNPEKHPHTKTNLARKYVAFITGPEGQALIRDFKVNGKQLFHPDVIK
jgi:tungstate transport system substrate-binding protein